MNTLSDAAVNESFFTMFENHQNVSFYNNTNCKFKYWNPNSPKIIWKLLNLSHLNFWILAFFTNFCPMKTDLSGNTIWPQVSAFQKLALDHFWHFYLTFVHSKCKRSSVARNVEWDFFCDFQTPCLNWF